MKTTIIEAAILAALLGLITFHIDKSMGVFTKTPTTDILFGQQP